MKAFRLALLCFLILCIFGFGLFIGSLFRKPNAAPEPPKIANTATVLKQVQALSELVTVKYVMEKVVILEDAKWYGENRVMLVAHGIVKAGIDFKKVGPDDIEVTEKTIKMRLPRPVMIDAFLDEKKTRVMEHSTGMLRAFDKDLQQNARQQAIGSILGAAREMGIEKDAQDNANTQISNLLRQLGFTDVELTFR